MSDKPNWRERLGIGKSEMPRISDEFKADKAPPSLGQPASPPQQVSKPAPMAPRQPAPKPGQAAAAPAVSRRTEPALPVTAGSAASAQQKSVLADRLRAQREAAEKLAAQRVSAARERAEAKSAAGLDPKAGTPKPAAPASPPPFGGERPKFSFADEPPPAPFQPRPASNGLPPLVPPRPALGGDRAPLPPRPTSFGTPGNLRQEPPAYRPIDPSTGYPGQSARSGLAGGRSPYPPSAPGSGPAAPRRPAAYEPPRPVQDDRALPEEDDGRVDPRLSRSMAARPRVAPPEPDDLFEDEAPPPPAPRRRASAADYSAAYRETEDAYDDTGRRSSGPWLLLLALLVAAVATGGIVWYYQSKMRPVAATTDSETVPVISAPEQPAKTTAETPPELPVDAATSSKKQIYDRIVGDQEVQGESVVPTEQVPVQPDAQSGGGELQQIPQPADTQGQGTGGATDEAIPLPLPPPPAGSDVQGQLQNGGQQPQPAVAKVAAGSTTTGQGTDDIASLLPAPDATSGAADSTQASPPSDQQPAPDASAAAIPQMESIGGDNAAASTAAEPPPAKPVVEKKAVTKTKTAAAKTVQTENLGAEPVVLVPPSKQAGTAGAAPSQDGVMITPPQQNVASAETQTNTTAPATTAPKRKTIFDLFKGQSATSGQAPAAETQVASAPVAPQTTTNSTSTPVAPKATTTGGVGYVSQLASFRTQSEAQSEYSRLKAKYPAILAGRSMNISQATVAGSTRYRLGLGPMASKDEASQVCGSLLASGERDCIVRKQ